jgi:hypothetical protein
MKSRTPLMTIMFVSRQCKHKKDTDCLTMTDYYKHQSKWH